MRTALITGGARGIGRAIGYDLAARGYDVGFCYRTRDSDAKETKSMIESRGVRALAVKADVSAPAEVETLFQTVERELGPPDVLVHCAGPYHRVDVLSETPEGWREMLSNNLDSFFYCSRRAAPAMMEKKWGRMLAFSMANADRAGAQPGVAAHYVAKVGVLVLARTLARALASHGVTVNTISPGFIASGSAPDDELQKMVKNIPVGYVGTLEDAVAAARFLLSDEARYVNGANIITSGGWGL